MMRISSIPPNNLRRVFRFLLITDRLESSSAPLPFSV